MAKHYGLENSELIAALNDPVSVTQQLLTAWSSIPLPILLEIDWQRGPLVLVGLEDYAMWPLLPPGTLLQLNTKLRIVTDDTWSEFERPVYLIEYRNKFYCCHTQRKGSTLLLISHADSPAPPSTSIPFREARVRGQLKPIFKPLVTSADAARRAFRRLKDPEGAEKR
jgi:hypothetical protein